MEAVIGDECRDAIDGRYPLPTARRRSARTILTVSLPARCAGCVLDEATGPAGGHRQHPWRYKPTEGNMTLQGPDLTRFRRRNRSAACFLTAKAGKSFLGDAGPRRGYGPGYHRTGVDIDGQVLRYAHGPVRPLKVTGRGHATAQWRKSPPARAFAGHLDAAD